MHRIDTPTAQKDKFGAGKNGFTRGNPQTGTPATDLDDDYFDMLQEELAGVVEATGVNLDKSKHNQLLTAMKALLLSRVHPFADIKADGAAAVAEALSNLGLGHFGYEPSTGETAIFNGNKNLRYFINNNNESGVASVDFGLLWGFDDTGRLIKGVIPVARLDGLSSGTGTSTTAVMSQKATTDAINTAKTTIVQQFGQSTTSVISQKGTTDLVNDAASVGVNQLWTDVTATRAAGVNYTNNTGRPIVIAMNVTNVAINTLASSLVVQGILMTTGSPVSGEHRYISAIVPPGQTYKFTPVATSGFTLWELRA